MVADSLDYSGRSRIANGKAFSCDSVKKGLAAGRTVESHVADDDVFFGSKLRAFGRIDDDATAGKTFTDVVVSFAFESDRDLT